MSAGNGARTAVVATDPLRIWWAALEHGGYQPHGQPHDFRSRCPLHNGDNREALHVAVGADARAVVHCFVCGPGRWREIAAALGLQPADSFPSGHRWARRRALPDAHRQDFNGSARTFANVLSAAEELGGDWFAELRLDCPVCGSPAALLTARPEWVRFRCLGDDYAQELGHGACTLQQALEALAGRIHDRTAA